MSSKLTSREKQTHQLILNGFSNQRIADELQLSINTVKTHVSKVLLKTGSKNRIELITNQINK
jgi:DNA-binding NarL/FixJ family response regulator